MAESFGEKLLRDTIYGVEKEGVEVVLTLGRAKCKMEYNVALNLAAMLYSAGKAAKAAAGDESTRIIGLARLTDANAEEMKASLSRDRTAAFTRV